MGVLERSEIVIIERLESASPIRVVSWIGRRMDMNSTAVGKALIAHLTDAEFDAQVRPTQLARHNDHTIGSMAALRRSSGACATWATRYATRRTRSACGASARPSWTGAGTRLPPSAWPAPRSDSPERVGELGQAVKDAAAEISARFQRESRVHGVQRSDLRIHDSRITGLHRLGCDPRRLRES